MNSLVACDNEEFLTNTQVARTVARCVCVVAFQNILLYVGIRDEALVPAIV